ncbi:MAG TPA: TetR/AcrR family transcriptional regulator [Bryobacteraceae bacterium]|jgi:AcrR family transcriptional regulator|nr:TetR/AcrR family transcriptional regulator [Bryobacteraceae bacterium]
MASHSAVPPRRVPQQERGQQRVFALLNAASQLLAEKGYEAATMSEVAERAEAAIGSLYQFFPNKQSLACALNTRCGEDIEKLWAPVLSESSSLDLEQGLTRLIEITVRYIDTHPVVLALQQTPKSTWNKSVKLRLELQIATFLIRKNPKLTNGDATLHASICMRIIKTCSEHFSEVEKRKRKRIVAEYKTLLGCYTESRLKAN